jgi:hypothetical protein
MFRRGRRDLRVGEQPLKFARTRAVEPQLDGRRDQGGNEACADRELHIQKQIEAPRLEHFSQPQ